MVFALNRPSRLLIFLPFFLISFDRGLSLLLLSSSPVLDLFFLKMVRGRRNVCSPAEDVLSVVAGFILIRDSNNGRRPVVHRTAAASKSGNPISNGEPRTRITSAVFIRSKRKSMERAPTTGGATVSNILTTCGATRLSCENGASGSARRL